MGFWRRRVHTWVYLFDSCLSCPHPAPPIPDRRTRLTLLLLGSGGGCRARHREPIRFATNPWPGYDPLYIARDKGYFDDAGLNVALVDLTSIGASRRAFERGQVDGCGATLVEILLAADQSGLRPQIAAVVDYSSGADALIAAGSVKNLAALRGVGWPSNPVPCISSYWPWPLTVCSSRSVTSPWCPCPRAPCRRPCRRPGGRGRVFSAGVQPPPREGWKGGLPQRAGAG
jgi:hypothetical protein